MRPIKAYTYALMSALSCQTDHAGSVPNVAVSPPEPVLVAGTSMQVAAEVDAMTCLGVAGAVNWSVADTAIARVESIGPALATVTGKVTGSTTLTAGCGDRVGTAAVSVTTLQNPTVVPELPRIRLEAPCAGPAGSTINVPARGDLQRALDGARPGDVVVLESGATFTGEFVLPAKPGNGCITIQSSGLDQLPAAGTRVTPAHRAHMARIVSPSSDPALRTAPGAHHYALIGLEFGVAPSVKRSYAIVALGDGYQKTDASVPRDIILERVYIHGHSGLNLNRCLALNSASTTVVDSYLSECHGKGFDSQAIAGWNGPGPFRIVNNYLEGAGENVMFGGGDPAIPGLVPSDIEFRGNYLFKPLAWKGVWSVKNLFELKNARRVLIEGNVFENNWGDAQDGTAILFRSANQSGTCRWCVNRDVTFRYNIVTHSESGVNIVDQADIHPVDDKTSRILIQDNVFDLGVDGRGFILLSGLRHITIEHNTISGVRSIVMMDGAPPQSSFGFRYNIATANEYGVFGSNQGEGNVALAFYAPSHSVTGNVLVGRDARVYPTGNFFPRTDIEVGFVALASGDYRLAAGSAFRTRGADGKFPGADIDAIVKATSTARGR